MTAVLEGGEWSAARPGRSLPPWKTRYPLYRRLGGPQGRSGRTENLVPTGTRSRTVQPAVSHYTDWEKFTYTALKYKQNHDRNYPKVNFKVQSTKSNLSHTRTQYYTEREFYNVTILFPFSTVLYIYRVNDMTAGSTVTANELWEK